MNLNEFMKMASNVTVMYTIRVYYAPIEDIVINRYICSTIHVYVIIYLVSVSFLYITRIIIVLLIVNSLMASIMC